RRGCIAPSQLNPADSMRLVAAFLLLAGDRVLRVVPGGAHGLLRLRPLQLARGLAVGFVLLAQLILDRVELLVRILLARLRTERLLGVVVRLVAVLIAPVALLGLDLLVRGRAGRLRLLALLLLHVGHSISPWAVGEWPRASMRRRRISSGEGFVSAGLTAFRRLKYDAWLRVRCLSSWF